MSRSQFMTRLAVIVAAAVICVMHIAPVRAGVDAILAQGFNPNVVYEVGEFDAVNTFSGDLMLNVPIGPEYKTNGSLSYRFGIRYTADFWAYLQHYSVGTVPGQFETRYWVRTAGSGLAGLATLLILPLDSPQDGGFAGTEAVPVGTAGPGWSLALGSYGASVGSEPYPNGSYTDESGASHLFSKSLHSTSSNIPYGGASYTTDGSYLRLRTVCPPNCGPDAIVRREIDFPDGTIKHFKCVTGSGCTNEFGGTWNLEWIADPFGNVLKIERKVGPVTSDLPPVAGGRWDWIFSEYTLSNAEAPGRSSPYYRPGTDDANLQLVRSHRVTFQLDQPSPHFSWFQRHRIKEIAVAGPDGNQSMIHTFEYADKDILRTVVQPWTDDDLIYPYNPDDTITVQVLDKIHLPAPHGHWRFDYFRGGNGEEGPTLADRQNIYYDYGTTSHPCAQEPNHPSCYATSRIAGRIRKVWQPTGGGYEYKYGLRLYPRRACPFVGPGAVGNFGGGVMIGVKERRQIKANGDTHLINNDPNFPVVWRYGGKGYLRTFIDEDDNGVDDGEQNSSPTICRAPLEFMASTLEPNGRLTISYYNIELNNPLFGAPFSAHRKRGERVTRLDGSESELRFLSQEVYEVDMTGPAGLPFKENVAEGVRRLFRAYRRSDPPTTADLKRSTYALYESSGQDCDDGMEGASCRQLNLRQLSMHTRYLDDDVNVNGSKPFTETLHSNFDGLGHYRQVNEYGNVRAASKPNYGPADHDHRIRYTRFNPLVTHIPPALDPVTGNPVGSPNPSGMPGPGAPWFLDTFTRMSTIESGKVASSCYVFDAARGYMRAHRKMKGLGSSPMNFNSVATATAQTGADDYLTLYSRTQESPIGVRAFEEYYGGDGGGLPVWPFSSGTGDFQIPAGTDGGPARPNTDADYTLATTMHYGSAAATEYYRCPTGALFARTASAQIDPSSGLPLAVRNEADISIVYDYDAMGRVSTAFPPAGRVAQSYVYQTASTAGVNRLTITRGDGPTLTFEYDPWARLSSESMLMPSGAASVTSYEYTALGDVWKEKLPKIEQNAQGEIEHTYDLHRRLVKTKGADGKVSDVAYKGVREQTLTIHDVAREDSTVARRTQKFDSFGRLSEVNDGEAHAEHRFDVLSNLAEVSIKPVGGGTTQVRRFDYDGRGVLATETHPEMRQVGGGQQVAVKNEVDARGHVFRRKLEWPGGGTAGLAKWTRRYDYDRAERLTGITRPGTVCPATQPGTTCQGLPRALSLKRFEYFGNTDAVGKKNRLSKATRTNYYDLPRPRTLQVSQQFLYDVCSASATNCTGDVTTVSMTTSEPDSLGVMVPFFSGTASYAYDSLGQHKSVVYPNFSGGSGLLAPARTLWYGWSRGLLTSVKDGPSETTAQRRAALSYAASGLVSRVELSAAGVEDLIVPDSRGIGRPVQFKWKWNGGSLETGQFSYDGAGNLQEVGAGSVGTAEIYKYDEALRLSRAKIGQDIRDYDYDGYGNLKSMGSRAIPVDVLSNRLTGRFAYDEAGHATTIQDDRGNQTTQTALADYDPLDMPIRFEGQGIGRLYVYDASDERVGVINYGAPTGQRELWSLRDGPRVVRDFERTYQGTTPVWAWKTDYVYRGSALAAVIRPAAGGTTEVRDVHVDHLGSTRLVTGPNGQPTATSGTSGFRYRPFGSLVFEKPPEERMAYTGHERDDDGTGATELDVDYMHARYYMARMGRFLSIDPGFDVDPTIPQSWNLYAYVRNSPMGTVDPTGRKGTSEEEMNRRRGEAEKEQGWVDDGTSCISPEEADRRMEESIAMWEKQQQYSAGEAAAWAAEVQYWRDVVNGLVPLPLAIHAEGPPSSMRASPPEDSHHDTHGSHGHGGGHHYHEPEPAGTFLKGSADRELWHEHRQKLKEKELRDAIIKNAINRGRSRRR